MAIAGMPNQSWRQEEATYSRLVWAFVISLAIHALIYGGYWSGKKLNLWDKLHLPTWLQPVKHVAEAIKKEIEPPKQPTPPPPLVFVDVSPSQAVAEPPKDAKFYSDRNSVAANAKPPDKIADMPKVDGKQTHMVKNKDVPHEKPVPLAAVPPAPPKQPEPEKKQVSTPQPEPLKPSPPKEKPPTELAKNEVKPTVAQPPGDLTVAKPQPAPSEENNVEPPKPKRPRTVQEALAQLSPDQLPGQKIKQDGGVRRQALDPGFDVAASPFGAYDRALIEAISQRWYSLLDARDYASDSQGKVVLQFRLHYDGRITDLSVSENSAGEMLGLICQKAILDPAPFAVWPSDMRRMLGDTRFIQFTFYYN